MPQVRKQTRQTLQNHLQAASQGNVDALRADYMAIVRLLSLGALVLMTTLAAVGCDSGPVSSTPEVDVPLREAQSPLAEQPSLRFTGRDSFGVAFKARISGTALIDENGRCSEETVIVSGSGQAAHLGRVTIEQSHCFDPSSHEITDGRFTYTGTTGAEVSGTYEGQPGNDASSRVKAKITGTTLRLTGEAEKIWGKAWIQGLPPSDGRFGYELDGYIAFI